MNRETETVRRARHEIVRLQRQKSEAQFAQRDQLLFEKMPLDGAIREAYEWAVLGRGSVALVVKGSRPMYKRDWPFTFNYFLLDGYQKGHEEIPVPVICKIAGIDPELVNDAYVHFRNYERWPNGTSPELNREIWEASRQVVTNLFPFPKIEWYRDSPEGGAYLLTTIERKAPFLTEAEIRQHCEAGKIASKAFDRYLRKNIRRRQRRHKNS